MISGLIGAAMPYKWLIIGGAAAALMTGAYTKGCSDADSRWKAKVSKVEAKVAKAEAERDDVARQLRERSAQAGQEVQAREIVVSAKIDSKRQAFDAVALPPDAIEIFNETARGTK